MMRKRPALTDNGQEFAAVEQALKDARQPKPAKLSWWFVGFMSFLLLMCLGLGVWQVNRLEEKQTLIARVEARINSQPIELPRVEEWSAFDVEIFDFQPVTLTGTFIANQSILVFTKLVDPKGSKSGIGYWVMVPLALETGGTVLVNRGFVPETTKELYGAAGAAASPNGRQTVTGIARKSESINTFTPGADSTMRVEYVRNVDRLKELLPADLAPIAPIYVNADATGTLPQGGETKIDFPNRHLEYAITWFALAGVILVMTGILWWHRSRK